MEEIKAEIQNQNAYNKILDRIAKQVKATEKAQASADRERQKLEKLLEEKANLSNHTTAKPKQETKDE